MLKSTAHVSGSSTRRNTIVLLVTVLVVGVGSWLLVGRAGPSLPEAPLALVPRETTAVARVNLPALRASLLWQRLLDAGDGGRGLERIVERCGFDPLDQIRHVIVFVTGEGTRSLDRVGLVARGPLDRRALAKCVDDVVRADGGDLRRVDIDGVPAVASSRGDSRAAFLGSDAIIGGAEPIVRAVLRTARGDAPSAIGDPVIARLWSMVERRRDVVAAAHVPSEWRPALERAIAGARGGSFAPLSSARAIGVGASLERGIGVTVAVGLPDASGAAAVRDAVRAEIARGLASPLVSLSALGPVLRRVELTSDGGTALMSLEVRADEVDAVAAVFARSFDANDAPPLVPPGMPALPSDPMPAPAPAPAPAPPSADEVIRRAPAP